MKNNFSDKNNVCREILYATPDVAVPAPNPNTVTDTKPPAEREDPWPPCGDCKVFHCLDPEHCKQYQPLVYFIGRAVEEDTLYCLSPYVSAIFVDRKYVENQITETLGLGNTLLQEGKLAPLWLEGWKQSGATVNVNEKFPSSRVCTSQGSSTSSLSTMCFQILTWLSLPYFDFNGDRSLFFAAPYAI